MSFLWLLVVGAAAGYAATRLMNLRTSLPLTIAVGVVGALVGGLVLRTLLAVIGLAAGILGAVIGALILIWLWETYGPKGGR